MTVGDPAAPGGRGNGLQAAAYAALADLDPRVAEALLGRLADQGIAAYVAPTPGRVGGYLNVTAPSLPTDRVWVDAAALGAARAVLAAENPDRANTAAGGMPAGRPEAAAAGGADEDAVWWSLVADLTSPADPTAGRWPAAEDLPRTGAAGTGPEEEHFRPPDPPPLPRPDLPTACGWVALAGGLALLVLPAVFGSPVSGWLALAGAVAVLTGFVTLVARLREARPPSDDDGAVV